MTFYLNCPGADLLRQLTNGAIRLPDEPYELGVIALATSVDDDVLRYLAQLKKTLDAVMAPYGAFLIFFNQATLKRQSYDEPLRRETKRRTKSLDSNEGVLIDSDTLRAGGDAVEVSIAQRYNAVSSTTSPAFVQSICYESDAIARQLGIEDQLPCLVFFDHPWSAQFYVMPLERPDIRRLQDIRELIYHFSRDPRNSSFANALKVWHELRNQKERLLAQFREQVGHDLDWVVAELEQCRNLLWEGQNNAFRNALDGIRGTAPRQSYLFTGWMKDACGRIRQAITLADRLRQAAYTSDYQSAELDREKQQLLMQANELLFREVGIVDSREDAAHELDEFVSRETDRIMRKLYEETYDLPTGDNGVGHYTLRELESTLARLDVIIARRLKAIRMMDKSCLGEHIRALQEDKGMTLPIRTFERSAISLAEDERFVLGISVTGVKRDIAQRR